jgi:hypothetical protein
VQRAAESLAHALPLVLPVPAKHSPTSGLDQPSGNRPKRPVPVGPTATPSRAGTAVKPGQGTALFVRAKQAMFATGVGPHARFRPSGQDFY